MLSITSFCRAEYPFRRNDSGATKYTFAGETIDNPCLGDLERWGIRANGRDRIEFKCWRGKYGNCLGNCIHAILA